MDGECFIKSKMAQCQRQHRSLFHVIFDSHFTPASAFGNRVESHDLPDPHQPRNSLSERSELYIDQGFTFNMFLRPLLHAS
jgi:hypothetical protein